MQEIYLVSLENHLICDSSTGFFFLSHLCWGLVLVRHISVPIDIIHVIQNTKALVGGSVRVRCT